MRIEQRLTQMGVTLPEPRAPIGSYVPAKQVDNLLFLSGKGPINADGSVPKGRLGDDVSVDQGYQYARQVGLTLIATMRDDLGELDRVREIVKVLGMVRATPEFGEHPKVINGCSDLFVEVFGEAGRHARSAVGMGSLPSGMPIEIEVIVAVHESSQAPRP
jgi:enamine deaminase RidA (YjgF/YER057c/UK114 family)